MTEIQLRWLVVDDSGEPRKSGVGLWLPESPENRETLELVRDAGNETFGDGTHWIVERIA